MVVLMFLLGAVNFALGRPIYLGPRVEAQTEDEIAGPVFFVGPPKIIITLRLLVPPGGLAGMTVDGTTDKNVSITCAPSGQPLSRCTLKNTASLAMTDLSRVGRGEVVDIGFIMEGTSGDHSLLVRTIQADDDSGRVLNIPPITVPFTLP